VGLEGNVMVAIYQGTEEACLSVSLQYYLIYVNQLYRPNIYFDQISAEMARKIYAVLVALVSRNQH
jgi:hypothetical protein